MNKRTFKSIQTPSLKEFDGILREYLRIHQQLGKTWKWKDAGWWDNERSNLSLLAGAVWKVGGIAFEEYSNEKSKVYKSQRKEFYTGRNDLYIMVNGKHFIAEAKRIYSPGVPRGYHNADRINDVLNRVVEEVNMNTAHGSKRLAIVFAVPGFSKAKQGRLDELINEWIVEVSRVKYSAAAWFFPIEARTAFVSKQTFFPGFAVFIRKAR